MLTVLSDKLKTYKYFHSVNIENQVPLPLWFNPVLPEMKIPVKTTAQKFAIPDNVVLPENMNELAFYSIPQLAS
ncbi:hypothetical protein ABTK17_19980, partial [Acinetobacter baumannii]